MVHCLQALAAEEAAAAAEQQRLADETARRLQIKAEKSAVLAPEVQADSPEPHTSLLFRLPDGTKLSRRFRLVQTVQELFDYLDSEVGASCVRRRAVLCARKTLASLAFITQAAAKRQMEPCDCLAEPCQLQTHCTIFDWLVHDGFHAVLCRVLVGCGLTLTSWCCSTPEEC